MKATLALVAVALSLLAPVVAGKDATTAGVSSSRAIAWSVNPYNGDLNLIRANGGGTPVKLCGTISTASLEVNFSPDDSHIFVTDGTASLGIHGTLYRRKSGLAYEKVDFDFEFPVQKLAMEVETGKKISDAVLDHSYLKCLGWSRDGQWVVLQLTGTGKLDGKRVEITGFKCAYHPAKRDLTNDARVWR